jgi:nicotinamidase-related amidase
MTVHLLVIDPQNDFCADGQNTTVDGKAGALYVDGAHEDMVRLAAFIDAARDKIDEVHVTLDQHHPIHIAHPIAWTDQEGNHPDPFVTVITAADVEAGKWKLSKQLTDSLGDDDMRACGGWAKYYTEELEKNGRHVLTIWPPHCIIGSPGALIHPKLRESLTAWEEQNFKPIKFVSKGSACLTEHYSACVTDVPILSDPRTWFNNNFVEPFKDQDVTDILIAGEALSHCVAFTAKDLINAIGKENAKKIIVLEDCTSNVKSFEKQGDDFVEDVKKIGVRFMTTVDYLMKLKSN